jgi:hypothetical protein
MKIVVSILTSFLFSLSLFGQALPEGKLIYDISLGKDANPQMASMMPKEATVWFKKGKSRFEMTMMMGMKNTTITDESTKTSVTLMDMMGNKYAIKNKMGEPDAETKKMLENSKVTPTTETKTIAGFKCNKTIIEFKDKTGTTSKFDIWSTKDLDFSTSGQGGWLSKIDGAALEFSMNQGPVSMTFTAREIVKEAVSDAKFIIPTDYKEMSMEDLMKMTGGR